MLAICGAPGAARTRNLQLRRLTLYPIELQAHEIFHDKATTGGCWGREAIPKASVKSESRARLLFVRSLARMQIGYCFEFWVPARKEWLL